MRRSSADLQLVIAASHSGHARKPRSQEQAHALKQINCLKMIFHGVMKTAQVERHGTAMLAPGRIKRRVAKRAELRASLHLYVYLNRHFIPCYTILTNSLINRSDHVIA
uniref:Uncharacterized protein n=1 Tax=Ixodes ricinus TaxID=34613 RepID=A0A6B0UH94_IXORI